MGNGAGASRTARAGSARQIAGTGSVPQLRLIEGWLSFRRARSHESPHRQGQHARSLGASDSRADDLQVGSNTVNCPGWVCAPDRWDGLYTGRRNTPSGHDDGASIRVREHRNSGCTLAGDGRRCYAGSGPRAITSLARCAVGWGRGQTGPPSESPQLRMSRNTSTTSLAATRLP